MDNNNAAIETAIDFHQITSINEAWTNEFAKHVLSPHSHQHIFYQGVKAGYEAAKGQWVAVKDGQPVIPGTYRVTTSGGNVQKARFRGDIWLELHGNTYDPVPQAINVIAWMPVNEPKPYTEETNGN